jgi:hypothetical protein
LAIRSRQIWRPRSLDRGLRRLLPMQCMAIGVGCRPNQVRQRTV